MTGAAVRADVSRRSFKIVSAALLGLALAAYLGYGFIYVRYTTALLQYPFDYDQGEGFELNDSVLLARGEWPYRSNEVYPFYSSNYPPLYHLALVPFVWAFGPAYWYGRLLSFLATLVAAGAIAYAVHRRTRDKPISAIAGLAFLASNYVYHIGPLFRQHISMVMFETLAVVILIPLGRGDTPTDRRRLFWGLLCLLAAGYTKQLAYATVAACLLFILGKGWRRGLIVAIGFTAVAGALFGLLNIATGGQWWVNTIVANINEFVPGQAQGLYLQWLDLHLILICLAALWGLIELSRRRVPLEVLWLIVTVINGISSGKWGAGEAYFTTAVAAVCLCSGMLLGHWRQQSAGWRADVRWATAVAIPLLLIAQAGRLIHMPTQGRLFEPLARVLGLPTDQPYYDSQGYTQLGRPPNAIDIAQGYKILAYTQAAKGPVLTEEAAFSLLAGKEQVGNPTQLLNLAKKSMLDSSTMVSMINAQAFDVIVLKAEFYPRPVLVAIGQKYQSVETIIMNGFPYRILNPRPAGRLAHSGSAK